MRRPDRPVAGAAVVCLRGNQVLLVRRGQEPSRGRWSFPGGKIRSGETAREAAAREAREETGVSVRVLDVVDAYDAIHPPYHYVVVEYVAVPEGEAVPAAGGDALEARWVPLKEVERYQPTGAMVRVLARARWMLGRRGTGPPCLGMENVVGHEEVRRRVRGVYVITDETVARGRSHAAIARAALAGGARLVQLREKRRDAGDLLAVAEEIRSLCQDAGALFVVNDRADVAAASRADGVHVGQADLPVAAARELVGEGALVGVSVENARQAMAAEEAGADYLGVGAMYGSASKSDAGAAVGPRRLRRLRRVTTLPLVAVGGITAERVAEVRAAGADAVAVIGAVAGAEDMAAATACLVEAWARAATGVEEG